MQDGSRRSSAKQRRTRITGQGVTRLPHRSRGQAYQSHDASLEGVRLNARLDLIVHLPSNTQPESPGKESQGCPTVHLVKHLKVHTLPLKE